MAQDAEDPDPKLRCAWRRWISTHHPKFGTDSPTNPTIARLPMWLPAAGGSRPRCPPGCRSQPPGPRDCCSLFGYPAGMFFRRGFMVDRVPILPSHVLTYTTRRSLHGEASGVGGDLFRVWVPWGRGQVVGGGAACVSVGWSSPIGWTPALSGCVDRVAGIDLSARSSWPLTRI